MKARTQLIHQKDVRKAVEDEFKNQQLQFAKDITLQTLACVFYCLSREYGWGHKRMERLRLDIETTQKLLEAGGIGNLDVVNYIKSRYDIDLERVLKVSIIYK